MLQIVMPAAGAGSRFSQNGYVVPKPFIEWDGRPMITHVMENMRPDIPHEFTLLFQSQHRAFVSKYHLENYANIIYVDGLTEGATCTVLAARPCLDLDRELVVINSDQLIEWHTNITDMIRTSRDYIGDGWRLGYNGCITTFESDSPKWSYARCDRNGLIVEVAEKIPISNHATAGTYYFRETWRFVEAAREMIRKDRRVRGEFYLCPVYNILLEINPHFHILNYPVKAVVELGTPEALEHYLDSRHTV